MSRAHTVVIEFMVENDMNQNETREYFRKLMGASYTESQNKEDADLRLALKQHGLLPLTEHRPYVHLSYAYSNRARWDNIQKRRRERAGNVS